MKQVNGCAQEICFLQTEPMRTRTHQFHHSVFARASPTLAITWLAGRRSLRSVLAELRYTGIPWARPPIHSHGGDGVAQKGGVRECVLSEDTDAGQSKIDSRQSHWHDGWVIARQPLLLEI
jgi:hypothetical protein